MVTVIATEAIDKSKQWVFITLEVDGDTIEHTTVQPWNTDSPLLYGKDLDAWCQTQEDRYRLEVLKDMYTGGEDQTVKSFETWIKDGCEITDKEGVKVKIEKKEWTNKHPSRIGLVNSITSAKNINDLKLILLDMVK